MCLSFFSGFSLHCDPCNLYLAVGEEEGDGSKSEGQLPGGEVRLVIMSISQKSTKYLSNFNSLLLMKYL